MRRREGEIPHPMSGLGNEGVMFLCSPRQAGLAFPAPRLSDVEMQDCFFFLPLLFSFFNILNNVLLCVASE